MIKVVGAVTESFVEDVSKQAGKKVPVSYLSIKVERTEPPEAMTLLLPNEHFRASLPSPFADVEMPVGTRVEVTTKAVSRREEGQPPLPIENLKKLP